MSELVPILISSAASLFVGWSLGWLYWGSHFNKKLDTLIEAMEKARTLGPSMLPGDVPAGQVRPPHSVDISGHPYKSEIQAFRARRGSIMLNCTSGGCTLNGNPVPAGELGPQCDTIPADVQALAMDDRYIYADDGERYEWRMPIPGGKALNA